MENFFRTNPNSRLSQEEMDFQGVPKQNQNYFLDNFVNDLVEGFKNMDFEKVQQMNVQNMSPTVDLTNMSVEKLIDTKKKLEAQQSYGYLTAENEMILNQINALLAMEGNTGNQDTNEQIINEVSNDANDSVVLASNENSGKTSSSSNPDLNTSNDSTATSGANTSSYDNINAANNDLNKGATSENTYNTDSAIVGQVNVHSANGEKHAAENGYETSNQMTSRIATEMMIQNNVKNYKLQQTENEVQNQKRLDTGKDSEVVKNEHLERIKGELKDVIPEMEVPTEMLMLKFGAELLKARSNKKGGLPRFLDELGQALVPVSETMMALNLEKQKQARELGGMAYEIYRDEKKEAKELWQPNPNAYADILTIGYDENGVVNGQVEFYKSILSPGEAKMYLGMTYPETINGQKVPDNLVGKPIFRISDKLVGDAASSQTFFTGPIAGSAAGEKETLTNLNFSRQVINDVSRVLVMGDKHHQQGMNVFGLTYQFRSTGKLIKDMITEGSVLYNQITGQNKGYAQAIADAPTKAEKELIAINTVYGTNFDYNTIVQDTQKAFQDIQRESEANLKAGLISQQDHQDNIESINGLMEDIGYFTSGDLSIIPILETNVAFGYARYIQGSNRLLKDVIRDARKMVSLDGWFNTDRRVMDKYNTLLDLFVNNYNNQLLNLFTADDIEKNGYAMKRDGSIVTGGFNVAANEINTKNNYISAGQVNQGIDLDNELGGYLDNNLLNGIK